MSSGSFISDLTSEGVKRIERMPKLMQSMLLKSNLGEGVKKPPPEHMAQKVYTNGSVFRNASWEVTNFKKHYVTSEDEVVSENEKRGTKRSVHETKELPLVLPASIAAPVLKEMNVELTLQEYFDALLQERGYNPQLFSTLETGYYKEPTDHQVSSYGSRMVQIVKSRNAAALHEALQSCLSPNACNKFGESLLHIACRRGDLAMLTVMLEAGAILQVSDDYGRTLLHDACWAATPAFEVVKILLSHDSYMFFMKDKRGSVPLSYVQKSDWRIWREWLDENVDSYFPRDKRLQFHPSGLNEKAPNSLPVPEAKNNLSLDLLHMLASVSLTRQECVVVDMSQCKERLHDNQQSLELLCK